MKVICNRGALLDALTVTGNVVAARTPKPVLQCVKLSAADAKTVTGSERVTWRNPSDVPVGELQFHLYLNGFRDWESTFMRES